ncbi:MAG: hypothetical protein J6J36_08100 [Clostridia bacterium]|nr:hypothetical protein [Clostridia bacterium]MBP3708535.1 hypothetical protein [Clostridia bacterium]
MALTTAAKQQLEDCCRLGFRNKFGEQLEVMNLEISDEWDSLILHEGTFGSVGLKRFYIKDEQINLKDKYHIPYRGFMMPVMDRDVIVIQCISGDFVILRIIGKENDLEEIAKYVRPDSILDLGMDYEDFKEANRRDLELHKRISTFEARFNKSPERMDINGNVITSLDHYDNYEYIVKESDEQIYHIYNGEKEKRRLENKVIYLEEKKMDYDYCIDEKYIDDAIDAIMSLLPGEIDKYFTKGGKYIYENIDEISFECELTKSQVWKAWKYMNWIKIEKEIKDINNIIEDIDNRIDERRSVTTLNDDDVLPNLFKI